MRHLGIRPAQISIPTASKDGRAIGRLVAESVAGQAKRFDLLSRIRHRAFPGGELLRTPALMLGMLYCQLRDLL